MSGVGVVVVEGMTFIDVGLLWRREEGVFSGLVGSTKLVPVEETESASFASSCVVDDVLVSEETGGRHFTRGGGELVLVLRTWLSSKAGVFVWGVRGQGGQGPGSRQRCGMLVGAIPRVAVETTCGTGVDGAAGVGLSFSVGVDSFVFVNHAAIDSPSAPSAASRRDLGTRGWCVRWMGVVGGVLEMSMVFVSISVVVGVLDDVDVGDGLDVVIVGRFRGVFVNVILKGGGAKLNMDVVVGFIRGIGAWFV